MSGDQVNCSTTDQDGQTHLKNWTKWEEEWRKVQGKIAQKLKLQPGDLVMNYSEGLRNINEEKQLLEYAKIPTEFDKYRGNPDFYKLPYSLPHKFKSNFSKSQVTCTCNEEQICCSHKTEPTYFAVKTKQEQNIVPSVDIVGVPEFIRTEKNILNGSRNIYRKWKNCEYRTEQMIKWSAKIENIVPHWPKLEHLVVLGQKVGVETTEEVHNVSEVDEIPPIDPHFIEILADSESSESVDLRSTRLSFRINNMVLNENYECCDTRKLRIFFNYDLSSPKVSVDFFTLENYGSATLRIHWNKLKKFRLFRNYCEERLGNQGFYFDKRDLVILPGQVVKLPIWFKIGQVGNYSESWEITTSPAMWNEKFHLIVVLESYAYYSDLKEKVDKIVSYIDAQARSRIIKDILYDLMEKVKYVETTVVPYVYSEAQLFEMANLSNGRPVYLFNKTLVDELKELFGDDKKWDYSVNKLNKLVHKRDTNIYLEHKLMELNEKIVRIENKSKELVHSKERSLSKMKKKDGEKSSKNSKKNEVKPSKSKSTSKMSDHSKTEIEPVKKEFVREPFEYSNQQTLWNTLEKFDCPVIINSEREKYFSCFQIMMGCFNKMCEHLDLLENQRNMMREQGYPAVKNTLIPMNEQPERLIYERFDDHYIPKQTFSEFYPFEIKHKPKDLRDVPIDDIELLYTTYFKKSVPLKREESHAKKVGKKDKDKGSKTKKDKASQDGKKDKDKGSKKGSQDKSNKKSKTNLKEHAVKKEVSIQSFDPYSEEFVYLSECGTDKVEGETTEVIAPVVKEQTDDYKYKEYLIVYSYLSSAVDAVVDTLESFEHVTPYSTLGVVKSQFPDVENSEETNKNI